MSADRTGKGLIAFVIAVAVCCGAVALLTSAGLLAAGGGLLGSPELTVAASVAAAVGVWRLVVALRRMGK